MRNLETVLAAYIECALWSSTDNADESGGAPLDDNYGPEDIEAVTLAEMRTDCAAFIAETANIMGAVEWDDAHFGHDFWLTRNGHGAGFWARGRDAGDALTTLAHQHGSVDLFVGDDGRIY